MKISNHKIRNVDIKPGMTLIVSEWLDETLKKDEPEPECNRFFGGHRKPDKKPLGDPILVLAVALPFITVKMLGNGQRGVLDTRPIQFMVVDQKYVRSLIPNWNVKQEGIRKQNLLAMEGLEEKKIYSAKDGVWKTIIERKS